MDLVGVERLVEAAWQIEAQVSRLLAPMDEPLAPGLYIVATPMELPALRDVEGPVNPDSPTRRR